MLRQILEGFCNTNVGRFTADPDVECLLCPETFHHPEQHQVELQTKVREDYAKFYNHGEGPYALLGPSPG